MAVGIYEVDMFYCVRLWLFGLFGCNVSYVSPFLNGWLHSILRSVLFVCLQCLQPCKELWETRRVLSHKFCEVSLTTESMFESGILFE